MEVKKLRRSSSDRVISGVCGGLGDYFGIDATIVRLIFVLLGLFGGHGLLIYLILLLVMPEQQSQ